jgi:hypothetical protein
MQKSSTKNICFVWMRNMISHTEAKTKTQGVVKKILREVTVPNKVMWLCALCTECSSSQNVVNPYKKTGVYGRDT